MFIEKILATFLHATPATNYQNAGIYLEALEQSAPIHGHSLYPLFATQCVKAYGFAEESAVVVEC